MRTASLALLILLSVGCESPESLPTSTALPTPVASLEFISVQNDRVELVWQIRDGEGRQFEIMRRNDDEPWKHFATIVPTQGRIRVEDTAVVPGQPYTYRLRILGVTNGSFLDEVDVDVPL
jgi:hypothetical protein